MQTTPVYQNILENMGDGVMTIDLNGCITTFNPAAARILGLERDEVIGSIFGELFAVEGMDNFSQAVLDAIYDQAEEIRRVVEVQSGGITRSFSLVVSCLWSSPTDTHNRLGVVAVFNDITEVKELRESELRLAEELKQQHDKLQRAYLKVEEKNTALHTALKKVQTARTAATVLIIGLFVLGGAYSWNIDLLQATVELVTPVPAMREPVTMRTVPVRSRPISATVLLSSRIEPLRTVNIASPISGKVAAVHFTYGGRVSKGQLLIDLDVGDARKDYRSAQIAHVKALERFNEIENWTSSAEVTNAQRTVRRAEKELQRMKRRLDETSFLLDRGVIPAAERNAAEQAWQNQQFDLLAAQQSLEAVLSKGSADAKRIAQLELENATARLHDLEKTLERTKVHSPVDGVILQTTAAGDKRSGRKAERIAEGHSVGQGEFLVSIGDLEGISVRGEVDEVDVVRILPGQKVRITGDAFAEFELEGEIVHVSSQAGGGDEKRSGPSFFQVTAAVDKLSKQQREKILLGMSANLEIVIYEKPNALMVPIQAVSQRSGKFWVMVKDNDSGDSRKVEVVPGITTMNLVEIVTGLAPDDEIVLP